MYYLIYLKLLLFLLFPVSEQSDREYDHSDNERVFYTNSGYAGFTSRVPLHTFTGSSNNLSGMIDPTEQTVDFYLDLESLKTGISRRDRDMYRTLDIENYPFAEFTGKFESPFDPDNPEDQNVTVNGDFTIHGHTQQVSISGTISRENGAIKLRAAWEIDIRDYDIEPPGILFYRVNDIQEVEIEAVLEPVDKQELMDGS